MRARPQEQHSKAVQARESDTQLDTYQDTHTAARIEQHTHAGSHKIPVAGTASLVGVCIQGSGEEGKAALMPTHTACAGQANGVHGAATCTKQQRHTAKTLHASSRQPLPWVVVANPLICPCSISTVSLCQSPTARSKWVPADSGNMAGTCKHTRSRTNSSAMCCTCRTARPAQLKTWSRHTHERIKPASNQQVLHVTRQSQHKTDQERWGNSELMSNLSARHKVRKPCKPLIGLCQPTHC